MELEADVAHLPPAIEVTHLEHHCWIGLVRQLGRRLKDGPTDHHADDLLGRRRCRIDRLDVPPVAHDGHTVYDLLELLEPVRDMDDPMALLAEVPRDPEQLVDLGV